MECKAAIFIDIWELNRHSLPQVPVLMNAVGGILVGLVTTYAGGVRKASD